MKLACALAAALALGSCQRGERLARPSPAGLADYEEQRTRLAAFARSHPVIAGMQDDRSDVAVAFQPTLLKSIVEETAAGYLDRVALDLPVDVRFRDSRDVFVKTFVGRVNAGTWSVDVSVPRIQGVLSAGRPTVTPAGNRVQVRMPVVVREGRASARVGFEWNARSVAGAACRDFSVVLELDAQVRPDTYHVHGAFDLTAGPETIRATPVFPNTAYRLRADLTDSSWQRVRQALDDQDKLLRCGIGLKPDEMMPRLRALLDRGFGVRLPRSLFRPIDLPGGIQRKVDVQGHAVELEARTHALVVTAETIRYGADLTIRPH